MILLLILIALICDLRPLRLRWHAFGRLLLLALSRSRLRRVVPVVPVVDPGPRGRQR
jgi:hypothetical protein